MYTSPDFLNQTQDLRSCKNARVALTGCYVTSAVTSSVSLVRDVFELLCKLLCEFCGRRAQHATRHQVERSALRTDQHNTCTNTYFKLLYMSREKGGEPKRSSTTPPASLTMSAPAAMSQQWMPASKYASLWPAATSHMMHAADPIERKLHQKRPPIKIFNFQSNETKITKKNQVKGDKGVSGSFAPSLSPLLKTCFGSSTVSAHSDPSCFRNDQLCGAKVPHVQSDVPKRVATALRHETDVERRSPQRPQPALTRR